MSHMSHIFSQKAIFVLFSRGTDAAQATPYGRVNFKKGRSFPLFFMPCCCCLSQAEYFPLTPLPHYSHRFHPTPPLNLFPTPALFSLPSHSYIIPTLLTPLYRDPSSHPIPIIRKTDPGLLQLLPHVLPRPCIPFLENIRRGLLYSQILRGAAVARRRRLR